MHPVTASLASGGLLTTALRRVGLMSGDSPRVGRLVMLAVLVTWVPLAVLCALDGTLLGSRVTVPFLTDPSVHARLLLALPLLIVAEGPVAAGARASLAEIDVRGLLPAEARPARDAALSRLVAARDSRVVELVILVGVATLLWLLRDVLIAERAGGSTSWLLPAAESLSRAGWWYLTVSLFATLVVGLRWAWWLVVWTRFVVGFLRPQLRVVPGHPDGAGGLAFMARMQGAAAPVLAALSITVAGALGRELLHKGASIRAAGAPAAIVVLVGALVMFGPLLAFVPRIARAKIAALATFDRLGDELLGTFGSRWGGAHAEPLLGSPDPSTIADFIGSYAEVRRTKVVPLDPRYVVLPLLLIVLPFVPLILAVMPLTELLKRMFSLLV